MRARCARLLAGLAFGTGWLVAGVWWLFISMHRYGSMPAWLAALAVLALAPALSIYLALAMAAVRALGAAAACWRDMRLLQPRRGCWPSWRARWFFTGFPWMASGYAQVDRRWPCWRPGSACYGIGARAGCRRGAVGTRGRTRAYGAAASVAVLALAAWAGPPSYSRAGTALSVSLLQTNVPQDEKFAIEQLPNTLRSLAVRNGRARGQLVVAPETAVPLLPSQLDEVAPGYMGGAGQRFRAHRACRADRRTAGRL